MDKVISLEILHIITKLIVKELDSERLLHLIGRELKFIVNFDRISITILNENTDLFNFRAIALDDDSKPVFKGSFPRKGSRAGECLRLQKTIYFPNLAEKRNFYETNFLINEGYRSGLSIPLITGHHCFGTINFNVKRIDSFSPEEISFFESVSGPVAIAIENALSFEKIKELKDQLVKENKYLMEESKGGFLPSNMIGHSKAFRQILSQIERVAPTDATVLISGETGTGKEIVAELIHEKSSRANRPLIKVNCAALPAALLESELFGYVRGAFTGAVKDKVGRFEIADRGSIFLDEISELSLELQSKLLRVLQDREVTRIGSNISKPIDFRVITATNSNLKQELKEGRFRKDLFFRLNVFPIELPPLRMRLDDLKELVEYFIKRFSMSLRKSFSGITKESMEILNSYSWPGNIRELENVLERTCILTPNGGSINILPNMLIFKSQEIEKEWKPLEEVERGYILRVLHNSKGKIEGKDGAAEILKLHPNTLRSRLRKLGITIKKFPNQIQNDGNSKEQHSDGSPLDY